MIDYGRAIQHPFQDKDWAVKMLVGAGVTLVPILNFAMNGYSLEVLRKAARNEDVPMPSWDDLGKHFMDGLKLFVVQLIYAIPILALVLGITVFSIIFGFSTENMTSSNRDTAGAGFAVITIALVCLAFLYGLFIAFITPAFYIQVARTGQIGSAFHVNEMLALFRRSPGDYILVVVVPLVIGILFSFVFGIFGAVPFVGLCVVILLVPVLILVTPYVQIVLGHLYGQLMKT